MGALNLPPAGSVLDGRRFDIRLLTVKRTLIES